MELGTVLIQIWKSACLAAKGGAFTPHHTTPQYNTVATLKRRPSFRRAGSRRVEDGNQGASHNYLPWHNFFVFRTDCPV